GGGTDEEEVGGRGESDEEVGGRVDPTRRRSEGEWIGQGGGRRERGIRQKGFDGGRAWKKKKESEGLVN
ncbi:hypothetical protein LINPERHAP2_LOCUS39724, partial [Linum perenne]